MAQATATGTATPSRSFLDAFRNPSGVTATLWVVLSVVPFVWPFSLYVVLRYATGHRAPGSRGPFPPDTTLGRHLRYPTLIEVAVVWIIGLFTLVGYVPAVYMTYRYVRLYLERDALAKPGTLRGRLTELDAAHAAGLITEDEHQLKRRALIDTF
jgi:hypothetical protein